MDATNLKKIAIEHFNKYDKNKSLFIEHGELKLLLTDVANEVGLPVPSDSEITDTLKDFDSNKDNKISQDEFVKLFDVIYQMKKSG
jgi:Ca2+-binding EF-hand superfamily protein